MIEQSNPADQAAFTVPDFNVCARGSFASEDDARRLAHSTGEVVKALGKVFDLRTLDGITIAEDYSQALMDLDRGYKTNYVLTPTAKIVAGVAMTPSVLRGDQLKSHIVLSASYLAPLTEIGHPEFDRALYLLTHECSHVMVTARFDASFPGILLRQPQATLLGSHRWSVILPVWDEYAACRLSQPFGEDQSDIHEQTFLAHLTSFHEAAGEAIRAYRLSNNVEDLLSGAYRTCGDLLKFAAYFLGTLAGAGRSWIDRPATQKALNESWFNTFFLQLSDSLTAIFQDFGTWEDQLAFESLGDIVDDMVRFCGVQASTVQGGGAHARLLNTPWPE